MQISDKVKYVKKQTQFREHHCHWPGCKKQVPPAMWGCREHWYKLPKWIRDKIWKAYQPGQEDKLNPSRRYIKAAKLAEEWIAAYLKTLKQLEKQNERTTKSNRSIKPLHDGVHRRNRRKTKDS